MKDLITSLTAVALRTIAEQNKVKEVEAAGWEADIVPSNNTPIYRFHATVREQPNGTVYNVTLDERGSVVDLKALAKREKTEFFSGAIRPGVAELNPAIKIVRSSIRPSASPVPVTIIPNVNNLHLSPGEVFNEDIHVTIPAQPDELFDVYFLADTTGSMSSILNAVKAGASTILASLPAGMAFGVGNYKDFASGDPYCFQHQLSPTTNAAVAQTAINAWSASGGRDWPEGQFFALDQIATNPAIGWRPGAHRIVVWFGDAPGHDPICAGLPGVPTAITEATLTAHLTNPAHPIKVLAISVYGSGLDGVPSTGDYPCPNTGTAGQATRIANATGGSFVAGINAATISSTIIAMVNEAANIFNNIHLEAAGGTAPFVTSITPATGYGPVSGKVSHDYVFHVTFTAPPCQDTDQVYTGTLNVMGDGKIVAQKSVTLTVQSCARWSYGVKFLCGSVPDCPPLAAPTLRPGNYSTEVNILNYHDAAITIHKYVYPLMQHGEALGREPHSVGRRVEDKITLKGHTATFDDCLRMYELMHAKPVDGALSICYLEIVSPQELTVTAVYTATDPRGMSTSIDVEQIQGKLIKR